MPSALLFDLDGTLCDTHNLARATWLEVLRPHGIDVDFSFYQDNIRGKPHEEVAATLLPGLDETQRRELLDAQARSYDGRIAGAGRFPGLSRFLEAARERGCRLALGSNPPWESARRSLQPLRLEETFDAMAFAEDVGETKPEPHIYQELLKKLDVRPEDALAFEDSPKGVKAAVNAGIAVVGLATTHPPAELRDAGATAVVADFADPLLYELLDGQ